MSRLRELPLVEASVSADATFAQAVAELFEAKVPAIAVLADSRRVLGVISELDVLRAVFPSYLAEIRHTAFLDDDPAALDEQARAVRDRPATRFARVVDVLDADESETHAAERLLHTGEQALPVVDDDRFLGMLSTAALCQARLDRVNTGPAKGYSG